MRLPFPAAVLLLASAAWAGAAADDDWQKIIQLDAGPAGEITNAEQARHATVAHLATQQAAYENFLKQHPADPHTVDAKLRLAHLLSVRADAERNPKARSEAARVLDRLAKDPALPKERLADVEFAKIAIFMRGMNPELPSARESLAEQARRFQSHFPGDSRIPPLLVELATLYDSQPPHKTALLQQAQKLAADEELRCRIADDLKRIAMLGHPVDLKFPSLDGENIDLAAYRGRVVVVCFFAAWSPPSMESLDRVASLGKKYAPNRVQPIGVSLDHEKATAESALKSRGASWPVACDGKGWESPMVRGFGINSLPLVWVLDKGGVLHALNSAHDCEAGIRELLAAPKANDTGGIVEKQDR
jgi:peroxiredoxin